MHGSGTHRLTDSCSHIMLKAICCTSTLLYIAGSAGAAFWCNQPIRLPFRVASKCMKLPIAAPQVRKELWQQQALAEAAAKPASSSSRLSTKQNAPAARSNSTSSQHHLQQLGCRQRTPARYAAAASATASPAAVHAAAAASKRLAKVLTLRAVLAGRADFATAYQGWEGSGFVVRLLQELLEKLWCKLAVQVGVWWYKARNDVWCHHVCPLDQAGCSSSGRTGFAWHARMQAV